MITDSFDDKTPAIIKLRPGEGRLKCAACVVTFSDVIEGYVLSHYPCREFAQERNACGPTPLYALEYKGETLAFYKSLIGAPAAVGLLEGVAMLVDTQDFVVFGGAGCLDREIAHGKVMVPAWAYRDEGTSYHYAPAADRLDVKNHGAVERFLESRGIPSVVGGTWTTDAFFRETEGIFAKRKAEGCISVEMECAALQAMCDFRGYGLYSFLTSGDLLDAPEWDTRAPGEGFGGTQHDATHFEIAAELACFAAGGTYDGI